MSGIVEILLISTHKLKNVHYPPVIIFDIRIKMTKVKVQGLKIMIVLVARMG